MVFHASRLECEKSMLRTVSDQRFLRFPFSLVSRAVAALSESGPQVTAGNADRGFHTPHPSKVCDLIVDHEGCISSPQCLLPCKSTGKPDRCFEIQVAVYSWPVCWLG